MAHVYNTVTLMIWVQYAQDEATNELRMILIQEVCIDSIHSSNLLRSRCITSNS